MTPRVIGLYSPAPQSGKTSVARYLERHNYIRVSFADTIKEMTLVLLRHFGFTKAEAKHAVYHDKTILIPEIGLSIRQVLQTLGTEWGRTCLHPDVWCAVWNRRVMEVLAAGHNVIADDVRALNEAAAVRRLNGQLWHITRPGVIRTTSHASEGALDAYDGFDGYLTNDHTLSALHEQITHLLSLSSAQ